MARPKIDFFYHQAAGQRGQGFELTLMAMPWSLAIYVMGMVWVVLNGWVSTCLMIADEIARGLRSGEIGTLPVG
ncbi:uncharacterized protein LOC122000871 isoform X1 [Zingiber officinale]|uniref:uncharacterized protein LOC122000871 isoform X1 n=1 Tax=Zingiber officinale TaxID=94328 RepID=UPI001C4C69F8|nr:uncharacterized protein LOC122000871 isoform X1 [Zingiber officinale]XP_042411291.1 uncharacterized protein LOC122000871 isoform X1 [Zingiber officinale]